MLAAAGKHNNVKESNKEKQNYTASVHKIIKLTRKGSVSGIAVRRKKICL